MEKAFNENGVKGDNVAEVKELFFAVKKDVVHEWFIQKKINRMGIFMSDENKWRF